MMRLETGVIQEGDDWPGVFIRGDNAFADAMALREVLTAVNPSMCNPISLHMVEGLLALLESSNVANKPEPQKVYLVGKDDDDGRPEF